MYIDSHTHVSHRRFSQNRDEIINRALSKGISSIIEIPTNFDSNFEMRNIMRKYESKIRIGYAVGVHPLFTTGLDPKQYYNRLVDLIRMPDVVGIGETGLDFLREKYDRDNQRNQLDWLLMCACIAQRSSLPMILHLRGKDAPEEALDLLQFVCKKGKKSFRGVLHSCSIQNEKLIDEFLKIGLHIGVSYATLREDGALNAVLNVAPKTKILLETDSPFLSPCAKGNNDPSNLLVVADEVAKQVGCTADQLLNDATKNAMKLFWPGG